MKFEKLFEKICVCNDKSTFFHGTYSTDMTHENSKQLKKYMNDEYLMMYEKKTLKTATLEQFENYL